MKEEDLIVSLSFTLLLWSLDEIVRLCPALSGRVCGTVTVG